MLVECGYVRALTPAGVMYSFTPSFRRIASLGHPHEIVELYAELFGPRAETAAVFVLASLCEQDDPTPLIGWVDSTGAHPGEMPGAEKVIIARHLMQHGITGTARPDAKGSGEWSTAFDASEFVAAARIHLGMSRDDAESLSMSEFQQLFRVKFPSRDTDVPDGDEYEATMALVRGAPGG